ncbi:MAG TPA: hypothetical protein VJG65_02435 [Patescibacteria group bacterium]|nr:hypothetical protein [Patescibacteria group bacterium]
MDHKELTEYIFLEKLTFEKSFAKVLKNGGGQMRQETFTKKLIQFCVPSAKLGDAQRLVGQSLSAKPWSRSSDLGHGDSYVITFICDQMTVNDLLTRLAKQIEITEFVVVDAVLVKFV